MNDFNPLHLWASMGPVSRGIALLLCAMGISGITITMERVLVLRKARLLDAELAMRAQAMLDARDYSGVETLMRQEMSSPMARVLGTALRRYIDDVEHDVEHADVADAAQAAHREGTRLLEFVALDLRRGMGVLASTGSVAPFVGLLGTVVGIITAFQGIAKTGSGGLGAVSAGIAEALVETALGLVVAIPTVVFFNSLNASVTKHEQRLALALGSLSEDLRLRVPRRNRIDSQDTSQDDDEEVAA